MNRNTYYDKLHEKNLPALKELLQRVLRGFLKIISIQVDEPEFGHTRVTIFFHEEERG